MSLKISLELSPQDLDHFRQIMNKATKARKKSSEEDILRQVRDVLKQGQTAKAPDFIKQRIQTLDKMVAMVEDVAWGLEDADRERVLAALAYFADPEDIIPDHIPVVGFLDDAIMIELIARELKPELEAYHDFCLYREAEAARRGEQVITMDRVEWLDKRRKELQSRMRRRRRGRRRTGGGGGSSSTPGSWFSSF
ncbi:MAG: hypothetical protein Tsb0027_05590 [Wenzhouxiangellaceae bacterium]